MMPDDLYQCYSTCGMKKAKCESRLDKCMREKCAAIQGEDERENCESTAKLFGFGAQVGGRDMNAYPTD